MTEKQAEAEIRYRLAKFLLFRLQEENLLTPEESEKARQAQGKESLWISAKGDQGHRQRDRCKPCSRTCH